MIIGGSSRIPPEFTSVLVADENLSEAGDFRSDLTNAIAVSTSSQLALKVSWQLLYDRQPSLVGLPLLGVEGGPIGDTVFTELDAVDNFLTFALVGDVLEVKPSARSFTSQTKESTWMN